MDEHSLLERIKKYGGSFTKSERRIIDFIADCPQEAVYMSISELAKKCGVGDATVFRFCKALRLNGYQEFKMLLAAGQNQPRRMLTLSDEISIHDNTADVCKKLLSNNISTLSKTFDGLIEKDLKRAVELLSSCECIYFFGIGSSAVTAQEAKTVFSRVMPRAFFEPDAHMQAMSASLATNRDVAMVFSYSGSTKEILDTVNTAARNGASVIAVTRYSESALTSVSDVSLCYSTNEGPFQGGSLSAKMAQLYIVDILYTEFFKHNFRMCDENRRKTTSAIASRLL